jgi:hypothetical protein
VLERDRVARRTRRIAAAAIGGGLFVAIGFTVPVASAATGPSSWGSISAPLPANADAPSGARLDVPVCPAVRVCWALGLYYVPAGASSTTQELLIERLSGRDWRPSEAPLPANVGPTAGSVGLGLSCPTKTWCVAVGSYQPPSPAYAMGLIDTYSAGTWSAIESPSPAVSTVLTSVSCAKPGSCAAIGESGATERYGFDAVLANGNWTASVVAAPVKGSAGATPDAVSCPAAGWCEVAGSYYGIPQGAQYPMADTLTGRTGTPVQLPLPSDAVPSDGEHFGAISCPAIGACVAVGSYGTSTGYSPLVETLANGVWTAVVPPVPVTAAGSESELDSLTCSSTSSCTAIGNFSAPGPISFGMLDTLAGGKWKSVEAPLPAAAGQSARSYLSAVSCGSPSSCVAVGYFISTATGTPENEGLLVTGSAGAWVPSQTAQVIGGPVGDPFAQLSGDSCPTAGYCVAVGDYAMAASASEGYVVTSPSLVLSPSAAAPGSTVRASLAGFDAAQTVKLTWQTPTGELLAQVVTDASGSGTATFVVPSVAAGRYRVRAAASGGPTATATLTVG